MASIYPQGKNKDCLVICYSFNGHKYRISPGLKDNPRDYQRARDIVEKIELDIELDNHPSSEKEARAKYITTEKKLVKARRQPKERKQKEVKEKVIKPSRLWEDYCLHREKQREIEKISHNTYKAFRSIKKKLITFPFNSEWEAQLKWLNRFNNNDKYRLLEALSAFQNYVNLSIGGTINLFKIELSTMVWEKKRTRKTATEQWLIETEIEERFKRYFQFLFYSSCRPSEALALRWCDIKKDKILIWRSNRTTAKPKNKKNRYIPLEKDKFFGNELLAVIGEQGDAKDEDYIFSFSYERARDYISEKGLNLHAFRHGFADRCRARGISAEDTAILMGNTPVIADGTYSSAEAKLEGVMARLS